MIQKLGKLEKFENLVTKIVMGVPKIGKLVKKDQMDDPNKS